MSTKELVLQYLLEEADRFVSGEELADRFAVSRTAIWKAVNQLRAEGYQVHSIPNRGYCLLSSNDILSAEGVKRYLKAKSLRLQYYKQITSTNTVLKTMAAEGAEEGLVLLAEEQSKGRGRLGRSFYSPPATGLYMSILLKPKEEAIKSVRLTTSAAVAVALALEELSGNETQIKWVNDIYMNEHKVCGILTEASVDCESGLMNYAVVGIGINTLKPEDGFPAELKKIAGSAFSNTETVSNLRCRLAASVLDRLMEFYRNPESDSCYTEYKKRSFLLGKNINILRQDQQPIPATAIDIDRDYSLIVRLRDGSTAKIQSGEVSVRRAEE